MIRVSVVVPTFRRPALLDGCLAALTRQDLDPSEYEILVADDADDAATRRQVESAAAIGRPAIVYCGVTGPHGPAAARNAGARIARGPILAFTDDDCRPEPGWLTAGLAAFKGGTEAVSGRVIVPLPERPTDYERDAAGLESAEFVTANAFVRRDTFEILGGFDPRFTAAWREDSDLHFRLIESRCTLVRAPGAVVVHPVRPGRWGVSLAQQKKARFEALLFRKHPSLYREKIGPAPRAYREIVATLIAACLAASLGAWRVVGACLLVWLVLTARFSLQRLRTTSRRPGHVAEMAVTSALIPPLSLFWRAWGGWEHRVFFA